MRIVILFCALLGFNGVAGTILHLKVFYKENKGEEATKSFVKELPVEGNGLMKADAVGAGDFRTFFAMEEATFLQTFEAEKAKHKHHCTAHWMGAVTSNKGETPKESSFRTLTPQPSFRVHGDNSSPTNPNAAFYLVHRIAYATPNDGGKQFELVKWMDSTPSDKRSKVITTPYTVLILE